MCPVHPWPHVLGVVTAIMRAPCMSHVLAQPRKNRIVQRLCGGGGRAQPMYPCCKYAMKSDPKSCDTCSKTGCSFVPNSRVCAFAVTAASDPELLAGVSRNSVATTSSNSDWCAPTRCPRLIFLLPIPVQ